jgi:RHS repeat-associated protein
MNRLTAAPLGSYSYGDSAHADAATAVGSSWTASYDAAGDMTCRAATSATTCSGSSPTSAQLAYDNVGQLATWQNAPGSSPTQSASYLYDGEGNRVEQVATSNGTTTTTSYIGSLEEIATSGGTTTTTAYYGGLAESVNGALSYLLSDGLGSVSEAVSTNGTVSATQLYRPYGSVREQSGTLPTSKGYTGQRADSATSGLDYYGARYYDPMAGQFTSADTMLAGGLNRYAYVAGNPETANDPTGHILRPQTPTTHDFSSRLAYSEWLAQPSQHVYDSSIGNFWGDTAQYFLGTNTSRQSFHTIFQDSHASAGDKWKAAGVAGLTLVNDAVTITSMFAGDPEVGETIQAGDDGLLAANDARQGAAAAVDATTVAGDDTGGQTTRLWRAVEPGELADVQKYGDYNIHPNSTFKRFAFAQEDLDAFIEANPGRSYTKTYIDILTEKPDLMYRHPDPGGVGSAIGIDVYETPEFYDWFDIVHIVGG